MLFNTLTQKDRHFIRNRLDESLNEERGINKIVYETACDLFFELKQHTGEMLKNMEVTVKSKINGKEILVTAIPCDGNMVDGRSVYRKGGSIMYIWLYIGISDRKIDWDDISDTLQHEISHMYQQDMAKKTYGNQEIYNVAALYLQSESEYEQALAWIVYAGNTTEQDAAVNGLYASICRHIKDGEFPMHIDEAHAYLMLANLHKAFAFITAHKNSPKLKSSLMLYKNFGWGFKKFRYRAAAAIKEMERKISRTLILCHEEAIKKYGYWTSGKA